MNEDEKKAVSLAYDVLGIAKEGEMQKAASHAKQQILYDASTMQRITIAMSHLDSIIEKES